MRTVLAVLPVLHGKRIQDLDGEELHTVPSELHQAQTQMLVSKGFLLAFDLKSDRLGLTFLVLIETTEGDARRRNGQM